MGFLSCMAKFELGANLLAVSTTGLFSKHGSNGATPSISHQRKTALVLQPFTALDHNFERARS